MTIEVTAPAPRGEHLLDERLKDETLNSLREPTWLITKEGQGMISGPEDVMEDNLFEYLNARENEGDQLNELYNFMLKNANKMGESFPGYLNRHHKNEEVSENYNLFMQKYGGDMQDFENFGEEKDVTDFIDPFLLDELKQQKNILNRIGNDRLEGIPSGEMQRLANGGPTAGGGADQELVNQRIAELMMEEPTGAGLNEMRATNPDMFERQKLGIERLLSNLYEPRRSRDIAETISTGIDFTPLGDPAAIAEGFQMMGDGQPFMGAALMAGSVFTNMPANKLKGLLKKADEKLDNLRTRKYQAESKMKGGLDKADFDEGFKESNKIQADINKTEKEITEIKEALNPTAVPESGTKEPDFFQSLAESNPSFKKMLVEGRKDAGYIKPVKDESGIINATPEINKLFREISESPSRINTPQHQEAAKLTGEQLRKINQNIQKLEPTERDRVAELIQKLLEDR